MSNSKTRRNIIGGALVVGLLIVLGVLQLVRFGTRYLELINAGFYIGVVIFVLGTIIVIAYVMYYD